MKEKILVVDDEPSIRKYLQTLLEVEGFDVETLSSGKDAINKISNGDRPDFIILDVIMPEMDGPTLLKELRKTNPSLKFIFVSGYPDDAFKKSLDENEAYAFLPKPFTLPQLAAKVKEQLGR